MKTLRTIAATFLLAALLAACETTESSALSPSQIIIDIEGYRLAEMSVDETTESVEFLVVLSEDSIDQPYVRLSGGDELLLLANSDQLAFTQVTDEATDAVRYRAEWNEPVSSGLTFTIRFRRESGESYDSAVTLEPAPLILEPEPGFEWNPDADELALYWQPAEPPVDNLAIYTTCTRYYSVLAIDALEFTLPTGTLQRTDETDDSCDGYVELAQEMIEGNVSPEFDRESEFVVDQAVRLPVIAQY